MMPPISKTTLLVLGAATAALAVLVMRPFTLLESANAQDQPAASTEGKAPPADTSMFSTEQKRGIEQIVKDYLIANPEIFLDVQNALEEKMEKAQAEKLKTVISSNAAEIFREPNASVAGNPKGDITVVEWFDYNCGFCKRGLSEIIKLVDRDPNVRVVFKELPILSKGSEEAAKVALAAKRQGKYWELHQALLGARGQANEASALKIAEQHGLDMDRLKKDMASDEIKAELEHSELLAKKMGINGTPHFVIGDRTIPGAPENLFEQIEAHVNDLRKSGCSYC